MPPLPNDVADGGTGRVLSPGLRYVLVVGVGRFPPAVKDVEGLKLEGNVPVRGVRSEVGRCLVVVRFEPDAIAKAVERLTSGVSSSSSFMPTIVGTVGVIEAIVIAMLSSER